MNLKQPVLFALHWCASCVLLILCWTVWLALAVLLAVQIWVATHRELALPDFVLLADDTARLQFLYERIYQRLPEPEEVQLGLEFVNQVPLRDENAMASTSVSIEGKKGLAKKNRPASPANKLRVPLTSWQEYAQALLQANETSFVN